MNKFYIGIEMSSGSIKMMQTFKYIVCKSFYIYTLRPWNEQDATHGHFKCTLIG